MDDSSESPIRSPKTASYKTLQFRNSLVERSPTLVGDSPPPLLRSTTPSSAGVNLSQMTASFDETPAETLVHDVSISSTISTRRKPMCRKCKLPRKGHKAGQCPIAASDDGKSLYTSSPESERRVPVKTSSNSEYPSEQSTPSATTTFSSISVGGKRKQPHCRKCGFPMKGHSRPNGILQCPSTSPSCKSNASPALPAATPSKLKRQTPAPTPPQLAGSEVLSLDITPVAMRSTDVDPGISTPSKRVQVTKRGGSPNGPLPSDSSANHNSASTSRRYRRNVTPTPFALSEHRSSFSSIRPLAYPPSRRHLQDSENDGKPSPPRRFSNHSPSPLSPASSYNSISDVPMHDPASQSLETESSFDSLRQALGEPELTIYPACDKGEVTRIRNKAKELKYFSGVVKIEESSDPINDTKGPSMVQDYNAKEADVKDECSFIKKWIILSRKEHIVKQALFFFTGNPLRGNNNIV